ncbi:hypothetical protein RHODGE_RHODGE_03450 [Rhodoplanes serenus]|uniref:Endonuclease/exonuclease/phosphatase domain-containing protein n=1 Tax=Rhodoplanes serenus TaxID=200615 RepID=A0A3S4B2U0_9BRAD|nr:trypsin-like peptidase domain-containing protein [Rhodoplanes serenus]VCU10262.1 hypothetical protein RHODGE_RHODGE_03450 [Rhodoplanes serenus]
MNDCTRVSTQSEEAPARPDGASAHLPARPNDTPAHRDGDVPRISFAELERRLQDIDVPDAALRPYFTGDPSSSRPFAPVLTIDPQRVELDTIESFRVENAFAMDWANGIARFRRQARFKRRRTRGERLPVLVAEGDSWFQFPLLLDDVIDQLDPAYLIWCTSEAGDTLARMVGKAAEYVDAIASQERPLALLFSAAGNDLIGVEPDGTPVMYKVLRDFEPGRPAHWYIETDAFAERLAFIEKAYRTLLDTIDRTFGRRVAVVLHGYDRAIPAGAGDPRRPWWAARDQWLGGPMTRRRIADPALQRGIVAAMIDRLGALQARLCGGNNAGGAFPTAWQVDVRGTLPAVTDWADELHPTSDGFARVARRFQAVLADVAARDVPARPVPVRARGSEPEAGTPPTTPAFSAPPRDPETAGSDVVTPIQDPPFLREPSTEVPPFGDLAGAAPVDDPAHMLRGFRTLRVEAAVGREVTAPAALVAILAERRRAVVRITARGTDYEGIARALPWCGTGFLVGPNLLLTNHHVLNSVTVARTATVEFDFEVRGADLLNGVGTAVSAETFRVDPDRLFVTSPVAGGLDFTFVWIEEAAAKKYGTIPMERASFTVERWEQAYVIHHPRGQPKRISLDDTDVLNIDSALIHYTSDTDEGSSGAPVLDQQGRLVALHHARQNLQLPLPDGGRTTIVNEGIKIGAIAIDLENRVKRRADDAAMASVVLDAITGSDSLTGYFGGLGRPLSGKDGVEAVVDTYRGTDQDVDIAFWNVEWLANRWRDPEKLHGAARVIADLNLDVWGLEEVSPRAVVELVRVLRDLFGQDYGYALSEPDAPEGKQSTAVIWRTATVRGEPARWPDEALALFDLDSRDPRAREEAVHGKVFDRFPGLFRFTLGGTRTPARPGAPFDFFLVPLHLKAMAEGSVRRRLAARLLMRATGALIRESGDADIILGGDVNAPLASGDLNALQDGGFTAMAASDEKAGGFTYLKSPKSLIDNIFLSSNLTRTVGGADFFIVARERSVDGFVANVSDHRPVLVRLSLGNVAATTEVDLSDRGLDTMIDRWLAERPDHGSRRDRAA